MACQSEALSVCRVGGVDSGGLQTARCSKLQYRGDVYSDGNVAMDISEQLHADRRSTSPPKLRADGDGIPSLPARLPQVSSMKGEGTHLRPPTFKDKL